MMAAGAKLRSDPKATSMQHMMLPRSLAKVSIALLAVVAAAAALTFGPATSDAASTPCHLPGALGGGPSLASTLSVTNADGSVASADGTGYQVCITPNGSEAYSIVVALANDTEDLGTANLGRTFTITFSLPEGDSATSAELYADVQSYAIGTNARDITLVLKPVAVTSGTAGDDPTPLQDSLARITGDPTILLLPSESTEQDRNFFRNQLGLDRPLHEQYMTFVGRVLEGDMGNSFRYRQPALDIVLQRLPATLELAAVSMLFAIIIALPIGILAAVRRDSWIDTLARWFATLGQATPSFWLGLILILFFAVHLGWLPTSGRGGIQNIILPAITLGWFSAAAIARLTRSSMLEALQSDFVRFERLSGLPDRVIVLKHALRNAAIPIVTYMALQFGVLLSGAVVTETVFAWPGIGMIVVDAINGRDYPVVQAAVMVTAMFILILNLAVDLIYSWLDPRIRY